MKARCFNPKGTEYANYGGRGITVCERWKKSFDAFLADMGLRPSGRSIDWIDNDGNYEPGNCRWTTAKEQTVNRRPKRKGNTRVECEYSNEIVREEVVANGTSTHSSESWGGSWL